MHTDNKPKVIVVSHTHWDREWYLTFEEYRYHLVQAMDRLLDLFEHEAAYKFMLDGQVIPLLDYLVIRPEREETIREFVRAGRLLIGPWYIQPDEFLVSGEALIRNLLLGHRIAQRFGSVMKEGYIPDTFGHIAQLPQILRGFGIKTCFLTRGADLACEEAGGSEFRWQALDGSEVLTHVFELGYCSGAFLSADPAQSSRTIVELQERGLLSQEELPLVALLNYLRDRSRTGVALVMNGCDHLGPQGNILDVLHKLNERLAGYVFRQGTLTDYGQYLREAAPNLPVVRGELRAGKRHPILSGVYSTRMYLKQRNFVLQTLLERYAEPLAAFAFLFGRDLTPFVWAAWELVLQNQAHDSICGTGVDPVHQEMIVRYEKAEAIVNNVIQDSLRIIGAHIEGDPNFLEREIPILVFNPCPWRRWEEVCVEVEPRIPLDLASCTLIDPTGKVVPFTICGQKLASEDVLNGVKHVTKKVIAFPADLPPLGVKLYRLLPTQPQPCVTRSLVVDEQTLENEFYQVRVQQDGTLDLLDKESGRRYQGLGFLEDAGVAGDEYNFSPEQKVITSLGGRAQVRIDKDLPWRATLRVDFVLRLPQGLREDRLGRSNRLVEVPVTAYVSLGQGQRRVEVSLEVENTARDHRLRIGFPTGILTDTVLVEDTFCVIRRPVNPPDGEGWVEEPPRTHPQKSFLTVEDENGGIAILNQGIPEYEVAEDGTVYLTLVRATGWLSRDDLSTRKGHAGPPYATPEAQCLGRHRFNYAICTYRGTWEKARLWEEAHSFCSPPVGTCLEDLGKGDLPWEWSFIRLDGAGLVLSGVKKAEDDGAIVVRLYNITEVPRSGKLETYWELCQVESARLDETTNEIFPHHPHFVEFTVPSGAIFTLKLHVRGAEA